jgi:hypothetical protein
MQSYLSVTYETPDTSSILVSMLPRLLHINTIKNNKNETLYLTIDLAMEKRKLSYRFHFSLDELNVIHTNHTIHKSLGIELNPMCTFQRSMCILKEQYSQNKQQNIHNSVPNQTQPPQNTQPKRDNNRTIMYIRARVNSLSRCWHGW